ncbi:MAG: PhoU domain-containing protein, partial [Syntrophothermus sp.]
MGNLVSDQVSQSLEALLTGNTSLAKKIIESD